MAIAGQSLKSLVSVMVAASKSAANIVMDFTTGSVPLALVQAVTGVALWLQRLINQVLLQSRASTSVGIALDSWMADFGFPRLNATSSVGQLQFTRVNPTSTTVILIGTVVAASSTGAQFIVTADATNNAYSPNAGGLGVAGYTLLVNIPSLTVAGTAVVPGSAGNVLGGTINNLQQAINGVDTVNNPSAFEGGSDPELDAAFRLRFQAFIAALFKGTVAAYTYALNSLQTGLTFQILENTNPELAYQLGMITICLDDGSGNPPLSLIQAALTAVEAARTSGVTVMIIPPTIVLANVSMTLTSKISANHNEDITSAINALTNYLNSVPVGVSQAYTRISQVAYDSSSNISNVSAVTLNGVTVDLAVTTIEVIKAGVLTIS